METFQTILREVELATLRLNVAATVAFNTETPPNRPLTTGVVQTQNRPSPSTSRLSSGAVNNAALTNQNYSSAWFTQCSYRSYNAGTRYYHPQLIRPTAVWRFAPPGRVILHPKRQQKMYPNLACSSATQADPCLLTQNSPNETIDSQSSEPDTTELFPTSTPFARLNYTDNFSDNEAEDEVKKQGGRSNSADANGTYSKNSLLRHKSTETTQSSNSCSKMYKTETPHSAQNPNSDTSSYLERKQLQAAKSKPILSALQDQSRARVHYSRSAAFRLIVEEVRGTAAEAFCRSTGDIFDTFATEPENSTDNDNDSNVQSRDDHKDSQVTSSSSKGSFQPADSNNAKFSRNEFRQINSSWSNSLSRTEFPPLGGTQNRNNLQFQERSYNDNGSDTRSYRSKLLKNTANAHNRQQYSNGNDQYNLKSYLLLDHRTRLGFENKNNHNQQTSANIRRQKAERDNCLYSYVTQLGDQKHNNTHTIYTNCKPPEQPLPVHESQINYSNRNLLDLYANLSASPLVTPTQIATDSQSKISNSTRASPRMIGWNPRPHDIQECRFCGFLESVFDPCQG